MPQIDGITFGAKEARAVLVSGIDVGITAEDSEAIIIGADSLDPEDIIAYGELTTRYDERVLREFAYSLLPRLDIFIDAEPEEDFSPAPGLTTTDTLGALTED